MQFNETFVTGDIKYDFISIENETHFRENWVTCRMDIKSSELSIIEINCYPAKYGEDVPLSTTIDFSNVQCELACSQGKQNSLIMLWSHENKNCEFFIAIDDDIMFHKYFHYLRNMLKVCGIAKDEQKKEEACRKSMSINIDDSLEGLYSVDMWNFFNNDNHLVINGIPKASLVETLDRVKGKKIHFDRVKDMTRKVTNKLKKPIVNILTKAKCKLVSYREVQSSNMSLNSSGISGSSSCDSMQTIEDSLRSFGESSKSQSLDYFMVSQDPSLCSLQLQASIVQQQQFTEQIYPISMNDWRSKKLFIKNDGIRSLIGKDFDLANDTNEPSLSEQSNDSNDSFKPNLFTQILSESLDELDKLYGFNEKSHRNLNRLNRRHSSYRNENKLIVHDQTTENTNIELDHRKIVHLQCYDENESVINNVNNANNSNVMFCNQNNTNSVQSDERIIEKSTELNLSSYLHGHNHKLTKPNKKMPFIKQVVHRFISYRKNIQSAQVNSIFRKISLLKLL